MTEIALTKLDVLTGRDEIRIAVAYELDGERLLEPPFAAFDRVKPVFETLPGWTEDIAGCRERAQLPPKAKAYIERIEQLVDCPVGLISVGADRDETANLKDPFGTR